MFLVNRLPLEARARRLIGATAEGWRAGAVFALSLFIGLGVAAQAPVSYRVRLDQPQTQMVDIAVVVQEVESATLDFALPTWRPGRYAILDPAGSLREVRASADGEPIGIEKIDKSTWRVETAGHDSVEVAYRVYANSLGDRTRHVDDSHAFLSGSSVFLYSKTHRNRPVHVRIEAPEGWQVATGLEPLGSDPRVLQAADYDVLVDSPIEVGLHEVLELEVAGKLHQLVFWPSGARYDSQHLIEDFAKIVAEQLLIFGRLPYERYVFLNHVGAGAGGGTEHLNSTIMQTSMAAIEGSGERDKAYRRYLGLVSHEFFHTWNVKQFRPAGIHPYDYQKENYTKLFWVSEGTTSYYAGLTLARAGLRKPKEYLDVLGEAIDDYRKRPGAKLQSVAESSYDAWIKFNRRSPDSINSTVSFYNQGELISLALDLEIRQRTDNRASLDQVMRELFERFPLSGPGFTPADLLVVIEELSDSRFASFFASHVDGTEPLELERLLATVGLELHLEPPKKADADGDDDDDDDRDDEQRDETEQTAEAEAEREQGAVLDLALRDADGRTLVRAVLAGGAAYRAGVMAGDEIIALDGRRLDAEGLAKRLKSYQPGDLVALHLMRYDRLRELTVELGGRVLGDWTIKRTKEPTEKQKELYESWIGQPWPPEKLAERRYEEPEPQRA